MNPTLENCTQVSHASKVTCGTILKRSLFSSVCEAHSFLSRTLPGYVPYTVLGMPLCGLPQYQHPPYTIYLLITRLTLIV
jgi:hypothetical protein